MAGISFQPNVNNIGYGTLDPSQGKVLDRHLTAPPGAPAVGARYIVASVATGAWAGKENYIAEYSSGLSWLFTAPQEAFNCWCDDEGGYLLYHSGSWDLLDKQIDHGLLKGILDDDHTQYLNVTRGDQYYPRKTSIAYQGYFTGTLETPPGTISGRYRITGTPTGDWAGKTKYLVQPNSDASAWEFIAPFEGLCYYDNASGTLQMYDGAAWNRVETWLLDHGYLKGIGDDDHTQYHNDTRGDARYYPQSSFIDTSAGATDAGKPIKLDSSGKIDSSMIPAGVGGGVQVIELAFGGTSANYDSTTEIPENALVLWASIYYRNVGYNSHATAVNVGYDGDTDFIFSDAELDAIDETDEYTYRDLDSYKKDYALPLTWAVSGKKLRVTITDAHLTATGLVGYVWLAYVEKQV